MRTSELPSVICFIASVELVSRKVAMITAAEMIFDVQKGQRFCFFETAKNIGEDVLVDFQVIFNTEWSKNCKKKELACWSLKLPLISLRVQQTKALDNVKCV